MKRTIKKKSAPASEATKALQAAKIAVRALQMQPPMLSKTELENLAESIATKVTVQTFKQFGVDITDDKGLDEFRRDMEYTRAWRTTIQKSTRTGWFTFVAVATTGFLSIIVVAVRMFLTGHP